MEPICNGYIHKATSLLRLRKHCDRGAKKINKHQRIREFALRMCLLEMAETISINSHQLDYLNMSRTNTSTDLPKALTLYKELPYTKNCKQLRNAKNGKN